jgi:hypothetical protein
VTTYRDPLLSVRMRVHALGEQARLLETMLTDAAREQLPRERSESLQRLRHETTCRDESASELHRVLQALESYVGQLEACVGQARRLERAMSRPAKSAPDLRPQNIFAVSASPAEVSRFWSAFRRLDLEASVEVVGGGDGHWPHYRARFAFDDCPFTMLMQPLADGQMALSLATSVARSLPALRLRPQSGLAELASGLGLLRDTEIGQRSFDETFIVDAAAPAARLLLPIRVQGSLLELSLASIPRLEVANGVAVLRWTSEFSIRSTRLAIGALAVIRRAQHPIVLVREA